MSCLRSLCLLVLCVAVFPWAAYAHTPSAPVAAAGLAGTIIEIGQDNDLRAAPQATAQRRCHGPALPGSTCQPDQGLLPAAMLTAPDRPDGTALPAPSLRMRGIVAARALDPPRTG